MKLTAKKVKGEYKNRDKLLDTLYNNNKEFIDESLKNVSVSKLSKRTIFKDIVKEYTKQGLTLVDAINKTSIYLMTISDEITVTFSLNNDIEKGMSPTLILCNIINGIVSFFSFKNKKDVILGIYNSGNQQYYSYFKIKNTKGKKLEKIQNKLTYFYNKDTTNWIHDIYGKYYTNKFSLKGLNKNLERIFKELNINYEYSGDDMDTLPYDIQPYKEVDIELKVTNNKNEYTLRLITDKSNIDKVDNRLNDLLMASNCFKVDYIR